MTSNPEGDASAVECTIAPSMASGHSETHSKAAGSPPCSGPEDDSDDWEVRHDAILAAEAAGRPTADPHHPSDTRHSARSFPSRDHPSRTPSCWFLPARPVAAPAPAVSFRFESPRERAARHVADLKKAEELKHARRLERARRQRSHRPGQIIALGYSYEECHMQKQERESGAGRRRADDRAFEREHRHGGKR